MGGKFAIMSALLVSLVVLGQIQVEAKSCCPSTSARNVYNLCRLAGGSRPLCASTSGCRTITGQTCPAGWRYDMLENTGKTTYTMEDRVAFTPCCPNATARSLFDRCRMASLACAERSGCILLYEVQKCPAGWTNDILQNTGDNAVNEYCKSGCVSSVCGAITTLQNSDASEVVNGAVEKCTNACSDFCIKGSITAVETAA